MFRRVTSSSESTSASLSKSDSLATAAAVSHHIYSVPNEDALAVVASSLAPGFEVGQLILLEGPLGAGKTALTRAFCRALGVPSEVGIRSPTFTLINEVDGGRVPIVHADFYRIMEDPEALSELGFVELCSEALAFVEWGAELPEVAPYATLKLSLSFAPDSEHARVLRVEPLGDDSNQWQPLLAVLDKSL